jgi:hypothetical protein
MESSAAPGGAGAGADHGGAGDRGAVNEPARCCDGRAGLGHSFPNGIQQDMPCERLAQIGNASNVHRLIVRGLLVMGGHEDDGALRSRCRKPTPQLRSRNSPAGRRLHAVAFEQRLGRGERPAVDAVALQQPRHALQNARIVIHDHDCRLRHHIRVQPLCVCPPQGAGPTLDLDQWNLVRREYRTRGHRVIVVLHWGAILSNQPPAEAAMLAEKFFLVLETLRTHASDGSVTAPRRTSPSVLPSTEWDRISQITSVPGTFRPDARARRCLFVEGYCCKTRKSSPCENLAKVGF